MLKVYHSSLLPLFDQLLLPAFQAMLQPTALSTDRVVRARARHTRHTRHTLPLYPPALPAQLGHAVRPHCTMPHPRSCRKAEIIGVRGVFNFGATLMRWRRYLGNAPRAPST